MTTTPPTLQTPTYNLSPSGDLATFHLHHPLPTHLLNPTEHYYWVVYTRSALVYKGTVDVKRFCEALDYTLQQFEWLFYRLHQQTDGVTYADLTTCDGRPPTIQLEIEHSDTLVQHTNLEQCLPTKADSRILASFANNIEDLQMAAFKLHVHRDGFSIGYYLNHAMHDQQSNVYLMKFLAHVYTHGRDNVKVKKPYLVDIEPMLSKRPTGAAAEPAPPMGYYKPGSQTDATPTDTAQPTEPTAVYYLYFNTSEMQKLIASTPQYISINDVINAIVQKLYVLLQPAGPDKLNFGFVANVRKALQLGDEAVGNFLLHPMMWVSMAAVKTEGLEDLAIASRTRLQQLTADNYLDDLQWYANVRAKHEGSATYEANYDAIVTNWSSFKYDEISYESSKPIEMLAHEISAYKVHVISFSTENGEQQNRLRTTLTIPASKVDAVNEMARSTRLFHIEEHSVP